MHLSRCSLLLVLMQDFYMLLRLVYVPLAKIISAFRSDLPTTQA